MEAISLVNYKMTSKNIIVTGANGQLGMEFKQISKYSNHKFVFLTSDDLDISHRASVSQYFKNKEIDIVINCAAYTKVDQAESETLKAYNVNANGVKNLLDIMGQDALLIHYSTDYVYQAQSGLPIKETEHTTPANAYALSKLAGDRHIIESNKKAIIIRTSWVYSSYGNNFVKTMLRLADQLPQLNVVNDQIGSPTHAADLANASLMIINKLLATSNLKAFNKVYHYSNNGQISWYDFAKEIFSISKKEIILKGIPTTGYPTPAKRPSWSVLDCSLIRDTFAIEIYDWKESLFLCLEKIRQGQ